MQQIADFTTRTFFDLNTFEEVPVRKDYSYEKPETTDEALNLFDGNEGRLLEIIVAGIKAKAKSEQYASPDGWHTYKNEEATELNGPFSGVPADMKQVNSLVLTLAKTVFGYNSDAPLAERKAAKEAAAEMIRSSDKMKEGLRKSAAQAKEAA